MICTECGQRAYAKKLCHKHYRRARRAKRAAANPKEPRMSRAERLTEMAWLIDGGVWPVEAARRVGYTLLSARDAAHQVGDERLLEVLSRERAHARTA